MSAFASLKEGSTAARPKRGAGAASLLGARSRVATRGALGSASVPRSSCESCAVAGTRGV
eukprot:2526704-Pleurochrysis_carterae.AAC.2